jgi:hypothetical protein
METEQLINELLNGSGAAVRSLGSATSLAMKTVRVR